MAQNVFIPNGGGGGGGSSPLTTKGDVYTYSTTDARLPVGADGQVLVADSAEAEGIKWETPPTGTSLTPSAIITGADVVGVIGTLHLMDTDGADRNYSLPAGVAGARCGVQMLPLGSNGDNIFITGGATLDIAFNTEARLSVDIGDDGGGTGFFGRVCGFIFLYNPIRSAWIIESSVILPTPPPV